MVEYEEAIKQLSEQQETNERFLSLDCGRSRDIRIEKKRGSRSSLFQARQASNAIRAQESRTRQFDWLFIAAHRSMLSKEKGEGEQHETGNRSLQRTVDRSAR